MPFCWPWTADGTSKNTKEVNELINRWAVIKYGSFPFVPPSQLSGCILFAPPRRTCHFLHDELLRNGTRSVTAGEHITYLGGGGGGLKRKRSTNTIHSTSFKILGRVSFRSTLIKFKLNSGLNSSVWFSIFPLMQFDWSSLSFNRSGLIMNEFLSFCDHFSRRNPNNISRKEHHFKYGDKAGAQKQSA